MQIMEMPKTNFGKALTVTLTVIFVTVITQSIIPPSLRDYPTPESEECIGDPIVVDYPFAGGFLDPHACAPQCEDQVQRYVLYSNGQATQCQIVPGCLDWGEDRGFTCIPPGQESSDETSS